MKVLLINGSPHKKGNTFLALSEAAKTLEQQGIETEIVQIGVKAVRGCIACGQCSLDVLAISIIICTKEDFAKVPIIVQIIQFPHLIKPNFGRLCHY